MGASGKLDPTRVRVDSVWKSEGCALARRIRKRLRKRKPRWDFKVVYSPEMRAQQGEAGGCGGGACHCPAVLQGANGEELEAHEWCSKKATINGSLVTVTATFGMFLASLVLNDILLRANLMPPERGTFEEDPDDTGTDPL
jgi:tRNA A37 threonylcarbamoyladenosine dehydratase